MTDAFGQLPDCVSRRHVLHTLAALGFTGPAGAALAARAAPVVSDEALRGAAALIMRPNRPRTGTGAGRRFDNKSQGGGADRVRRGAGTNRPRQRTVL
jgi:hypothetical protein